MPQKKIILIGGGGHCRAVIDVLEMEGVYQIEGILDIKEQVGNEVLGYRIIGTDDDIELLVNEERSFLITIGQIKSGKIREDIFTRLKRSKAHMPTIVSPSAYVSRHASIDEGSVVMHHATVNANAVIGSNNIINTGSNIEHDVHIGDHCHISTHAVLNGGCKLGNSVFIGSNSVVSQGITIVDNVVIGAGSVIHKPITEEGVYAGNPYKRI